MMLDRLHTRREPTDGASNTTWTPVSYGEEKEETFGQKLDAVLCGRGQEYGGKIAHFSTTPALMSLWRQLRAEYLREGQSAPLDDPLEFALEHCVYLVMDKMVRLAASPEKFDSWLDVAGYAGAFTQAREEFYAGDDIPPRKL